MIENGTLKVTRTGNADRPVAHGATALQTIDVGGHAADGINYHNPRQDGISTFLGQLINGDFAAANPVATERAISGEAALHAGLASQASAAGAGPRYDRSSVQPVREGGAAELSTACGGIHIASP